MAIEKEGDVQNFSYTGGMQSFTIPFKGIYKLEVWGGTGSSGGYYANSSSTTFAAGGESIGYKIFEKDTVIYICCGGGKGNRNYNGGGAPTKFDGSVQSYYAGYGAGATHMALVSGTLSSIGKTSFVDNGNGLIVAGGGGGTAEGHSTTGGTGGGLIGGTAKGYYTITGGTQTAGGSNSYFSGSGTSHHTHGKFGAGGRAEDNDSSKSGQNGGGGGGGFYGGAGGCYSSGTNQCGGGGGSGWIGGVPEFTYRGVTYSPSTTNGVNSSGNGYAKITLVKKIGNEIKRKYIIAG